MSNESTSFSEKVSALLQMLPEGEISKAVQLIHDVYDRDGRIYCIGNGGSYALVGILVSDLNKTVFNDCKDSSLKRFQAFRIPSTQEELTAWANDCGYDAVFSSTLTNYLRDGDLLIAVSSSGNSKNIIMACEYARAKNVQVIGFSGFSGSALNALADAKIYASATNQNTEIIESVHAVIIKQISHYFKEYFSRARQ